MTTGRRSRIEFVGSAEQRSMFLVGLLIAACFLALGLLAGFMLGAAVAA